MSRYFSGNADDLGHVHALPQETFVDLCYEVIQQPIQLALTREQFHALPKKDKEAPLDQQRAKRVRYITPCVFRSSPSPRQYEAADRCNLIALDIDSAAEAKRLLTQRWDELLGEFGYVVWHTASSTPEAPRLRVLVSAEGITREQYRAAVRTVAEMIGLTTVTTESRVIVQPMYLPTTFAGDDTSPIVAINSQGDAFRSFDIVADDESSLAPSPTLDSKVVADLEYLRTPLEGITLADAEDALKALDPDMPMQQWIEVAAGLKHQFNSDEAYQLWDTWSAKGKKYVDANETRYRWDSLKANPPDRMPVTIRSVFKAAQARGWSNLALAKRYQQETLGWLKNPQRSTEELLDQAPKRIAKVSSVVGQLEKKMLMVELKNTLAGRSVALPLPDIKKEIRRLEIEALRSSGVPQWCKGLCFVTALNEFYRHTTDRHFSPEVLDLMYSVPSVGEETPMRPRDYAVQIASVSQVENLRYDPAHGSKRFFSEGGVPYVNTYRADYAAATPETADEAGAAYLDHLTKLIAEPEYRTIITDFLAYHVQFPGKKVRWAPLIQGAEGCGKTVLAVILKAILGRRNVSKLNGQRLMTGDYNDWAYGKQVVAIEEIRVVGHNRYAVMDKIKDAITDDDLDLSCKYESHRTVENVTNYLMFTNYHDALAVRDDGRRYFCLSSPLQTAQQIQEMGGKEHFNQLYGMIRDNAGGFRAWFEQYKISPAFEPEGRASVTKYLHAMADNAASPLMHAVKETIDDEPHPLVRKDLLSLNCLRACLDVARIPEYTDQALAGVLRELGWTKFDRCTVDGAKHQLWTKGEFKKAQRAAEIRATLF